MSKRDWMLNKIGWNIISSKYQQHTRISLDDVHYGPISPGEKELRLLGDIKGKDVLEIGCGGGQNIIVLAKWGARAVGLDISEKQIEYARYLARKEGVDVKFYVGNMEDLSIFESESFDIVLSCFAIGYVRNIFATFREVYRVLRHYGIFVFCDVHPIVRRGRILRYGKKRIWGIFNYFNRKGQKWRWNIDGAVAYFCDYHRTLQDYFDLLICSGFVVERILEPEPYPLDKMSDEEKSRIPYINEGFERDYDLWRRIPYTIIFKSRKY